MGILDIIILGVALSVDSFALSVVIGLSGGCIANLRKYAFVIAVSVIHAIMILSGWYGGDILRTVVASYDSWIAAGILTLLGGKMIKDSFSGARCERSFTLDAKEILLLSIALSIDALASGFSFAMVRLDFCGTRETSIIVASLVISLVVMIITSIGLYAGKYIQRVLGEKLTSYTGILAGAVLIGIALKIVLVST